MDWGLGLRPQHFREWLDQESWPLFEVLSDNYIYQQGGPALEYLDQLTRHRKPFLHGIGLNIGGLDDLDLSYLKKLKTLQLRTRAEIISDHLAFCRGQGIETYDLLPLPYTGSELKRVADRINAVQDFLGQAISLENISAYVQFAHSSMSEIEFLLELSLRTQCKILLDVNNLYVSGHNLGWNAEQQLRLLDADRVSYMHVSGYSYRGTCLYDSHDQAVSDGVLSLLKAALAQGLEVPVILERDDPDLSHQKLLDEWQRIRQATEGAAAPDHSYEKQERPRHRTEPHADSSGFQQRFMDSLMSDLTARPSSTTLELDTASAGNWDIYVNGIVGRWTGLVDATLKRATQIWGHEAMAELLWDFASLYPPQNADMSRAFRALPPFIRDHPEYSLVSGLADLVEACFVYWEVLEGVDPDSKQKTAEPSEERLQLRLQQPAVLLLPMQKGLDLHRLWSISALDSQDLGSAEWEQLNSQETGILFVKSSPHKLSILRVETLATPLLRALVLGHTIEESIDFLLEHAQEALETDLALSLQETLLALTTVGLLVQDHVEGRFEEASLHE